MFIAHGRSDPIMDVDFARQARALIEAGGLPTSTTTSPTPRHHIDPAHVPAAVECVASTLSTRA